MKVIVCSLKHAFLFHCILVEIVDRHGHGNAYDLAIESIYEEIKNVLGKETSACPVVKLDDGRKVNLHRAFRRKADGNFKEVFIGLDEDMYCLAHVVKPDGTYASIDEVRHTTRCELLNSPFTSYS